MSRRANTCLRAAMDADQVPYSEAEFALLVKIRGIRTKVLHGQGRKLPSEEELGLALVNRVLLFRLGGDAPRVSRRRDHQSQAE